MRKDQQYQYRFSDIEKYLKGEMSHAEMHALEKAAITDPFLADAIEGYQQSNLKIAGKQLAEIQKNVVGNEVMGQVVPISRGKRHWLQIAATFVLVSGVATISWILINQTRPGESSTAVTTKNDHHLKNRVTDTPITPVLVENVQQKKDLSRKQAIKVNTFQPGSTKGNTDSLNKVSEPVLAQINLPAQALRAETTAKKVFFADSVITSETLTKSTAMLTQKNNFPQILQGRAAGVVVKNPPNQYLINGRVTDAQLKPLSNASILVSTVSQNKTIPTNIDGSFQFYSKDSLANITVSSLGYHLKKSTVSPTFANVVTLDTFADALDEVVIIKDRKPKKQLSAGAAQSVIPPAIKLSSAQPAGGMRELIAAIQKKWQLQNWDQRSLIDNISSILTFDSTGHVTDVKFSQPINRQFRKRFTNFLKEGPAWFIQGLPATGKHEVLIVF